jgi:hypothetical protein
MQRKLAFMVAFALAAVALNIASASAFILDTGTPQGATFPILNSIDWFGAEFSATAGQTITELSAYLEPNTGGQGTAFTFAIYSDAGFIGGRNLTAQYTVGATFESGGWNSAVADWTVPTTGDYWVVLEMSSSGRNPPALDLVTETSDTTGTVPALAFANTDASSHIFALETSAPFGIEVTATPLPAALPLFATGLGGLGLFGWRRKRKVQAVAV